MRSEKKKKPALSQAFDLKQAVVSQIDALLHQFRYLMGCSSPFGIPSRDFKHRTFN
jgi:hypothetical protein